MPSLFTPQALAPYAQVVNSNYSKQMGVSGGPSDNPPDGNKLYKAGQLSLLGSNAFDLATTIRSLNKGGYEEDPSGLLGHSLKTIIPMKAGLTALQMYAAKKLKDSGHPNLAGILGVGASLPMAKMGLLNLGIIHDN